MPLYHMLICKELEIEETVLVATPAGLDPVGSVKLDLLDWIDELQALEEVAGTLLCSELLKSIVIVVGIPGLIIILLILKAGWHLLKLVRLVSTKRAVLACSLDLLLIKPCGQAREVKGVRAGKLDLTRSRSDCVETDRAVHFVCASCDTYCMLKPKSILYNMIKKPLEL